MSWKWSGVYQSLDLDNAIFRESWGGVDRTEYCFAVLTWNWCKLTSYLKSKPTNKQKWGCPIGARHLLPKTLRLSTGWQTQCHLNDRGLSIPGITLELNKAILRKSWGGVEHTEYCVRPSIPEVDKSWLQILSLSPHASKSEVVLFEQGHFCKNTLAEYSLTKSMLSKRWEGY